MKFLFTLSLFLSSVLAIDYLYDGTAQPGFDASTLDNSNGPYLTYAISLFNGQGACLTLVCAVPSRDLSWQAMYVLRNSGRVHPGKLTTEPNPVHSFR